MFAQFLQPAPKKAGVGRLLRFVHRWVSALFVLCVIAATAALFQPKPVHWMAYVPLFPLALLALSGIYLFIAPYLPKQRAGL